MSRKHLSPLRVVHNFAWSLLLFVCTNVVAQSEEVGTPKVIPPSPTASALIKYSDIPVSYATGIPQVQIPIYEIKGKEIGLPIVLSYHGGGVKVDERPGWLGLSWSLTGANSVITRTIRGLPDSDISLGYTENFSTINQPVISESLQDLIITGGVDSEPDSYSYNFSGRSGKIMFTQEGPVTIPFENLGVGIDEGDASIVTEDGTMYHFGATEKYLTSELQEYTQSWYLTSITNANKTETITFEYTEPYLVDDPYEPVTIVKYFNTAECPAKVPEGIDRGQIRKEVRLKKIKFENTELKFYGLTRLDSIVVHESGVRTKRFILTLGDFLVKVVEEAIDHEGKIHPNVRRHILSYNAYTGGNLQKDHWGYQNGALSNTDLFPISLNSTPPANREASGNAGVQSSGALASITYPTGGFTSFEYEANTYWKGDEDDYFANGQINAGRDLTWTNAMGNETITGNKFFTMIRGEEVSIGMSYVYNNNEGEGSVFDEGQTMTFKLFKVGNAVPLYTYNSPTGPLSDVETPIKFPLSPGEYEARITIVPPISSALYAMTLNADILHTNYVPNNGVRETPAGGIRIKKITSRDGTGVNADIVRTFQYARKDASHGIERMVSSGALSIMPNYDYAFTEYDNSGVPCVVTAVTNGDEAIAGIGSPVYYTEVTELIGTGGTFGKNQYFFRGTSTHQARYPFTPQPVDYLAGLADSVIQYKRVGSQFEVVHKSRTFYNLDDLTHRHSIQGVKVFLLESNINSPDPIITGFTTYNVATSWFHITKKTETSFLNGQVALESVINYTYNPDHIQLSKTEEENSDGSITIKEMKYPDDFTGADPTLAAMKSSHMVGRVIQEFTKRKKGNDVTIENAVINKYAIRSMPNFTTGVLIKDLYKFKSTQPVPDGSLPFNSTEPFSVNTNYFESRLTFDDYDDRGNVLQLTPENKVPVSYIWDCDGRWPVAQAVNALHSAICYTGFECNTHGGWTLNGGSLQTGTGNFVTGERGWAGAVLSKTSLASGNYIISLWAKGSGTVVVNGVSKNVSTDWTFLEWKVASQGSVTVTTNGNIVDEVRLMPAGAMMTTYTYDPVGRKISETDVNNRHTFFEYDDFKQLMTVRNHYREILKRYEYHYKN